MRQSSIAKFLTRCAALSLALLGILVLSGCSQTVDNPAFHPLSPASQKLLNEKGLDQNMPLFVRIFKEESELEVWKARADGEYHHFKTYPICKWSGRLGPKLREGDKQAPEGFYKVNRGRLNPKSSFHLSYNIGYPNAFDKAHGRTGANIMVHGDCRSAGCYAMTDALAEELFILARESFEGGQSFFHVHVFPFRMSEEKMEAHKTHKWIGFWRQLKPGYDYFETYRQPPKVDVCGKAYHVNRIFKGGAQTLNASAPCPRSIEMPQPLSGSNILVNWDGEKPEIVAEPLGQENGKDAASQSVKRQVQARPKAPQKASKVSTVPLEAMKKAVKREAAKKAPTTRLKSVTKPKGALTELIEETSSLEAPKLRSTLPD